MLSNNMPGLADAPFFTIFLFFFLSVLLLAQSAITLYTYNKNKKAKDLNYRWSIFVLLVSIIALFISGFAMVKHRQIAKEAVVTALGGQLPQQPAGPPTAPVVGPQPTA